MQIENKMQGFEGVLIASVKLPHATGIIWITHFLAPPGRVVADPLSQQIGVDGELGKCVISSVDSMQKCMVTNRHANIA